MPKVLVIAPSQKTKGGISAVLNAYRTTPIWDEFACRWVATNIDRSNFWKIVYFIAAWLQCLVMMPFYDIVHIHFSLPGSAMRKYRFFRMAKFYRKKVIIHLHCGDQLPQIWSKRYETMFSEADLALVLSEKVKKDILSRMGDSCRVEVLYNPCIKPPVVPIEALREKIILVSGKICQNKGYEDILSAWGKVAPSFPEWKLVFVGDGEIKQAKALAESLGVGSQTEFPGWVENQMKDKAFRTASALCMGSYMEGFPMAVLDAFAYGLSVISSKAGGITDVAIDGENVLLFDAGDVETLSSKIKQLLSSATLRKQLSAAALELSRTVFSIETITSTLSNYYKELSI